MKKLKIKFKAQRAADDEQKAVIPAIIYISMGDALVNGFIIMLGWWDFPVSIRVFWRNE